MPFLTVLLTYLLSRFTPACSLVQRDSWFNSAVDHWGERQPGVPFTFFLVIGGTLLAMALLLWRMNFWFEWLTGTLLVLYSLGRRDVREHHAGLLRQLRDGRAETVWLTLEAEGSLDRQAGTDALWLALRRHSGYEYLNGLFAVFFWFCVAGPAGPLAALLLRLLHLYQQHARVRDGRLPAFNSWTTAMEWLPARYMALCFCLAGNFTTGFHAWRQLVLDTRLGTADFLARCIDAALVIETSAPDAETGPAQATGYHGEETGVTRALVRGHALLELLARTELIGLVGLSVAVLLLA